ncbi:MAG: OsmC family protein [Hyphomicrobiales bacterium]
MKTAEVIYKGNLRTESKHIRSGNTMITDAPVDNHGKGEAFSPTDLVASALASCMITIMGIVAENHGINIEGSKADVTKIMSAEPRRIGEIIVEFQIPYNLTDKEKKILEKAAYTCPVHYSLHPEVKKTITFRYNDK